MENLFLKLNHQSFEFVLWCGHCFLGLEGKNLISGMLLLPAMIHRNCRDCVSCPASCKQRACTWFLEKQQGPLKTHVESRPSWPPWGGVFSTELTVIEWQKIFRAFVEGKPQSRVFAWPRCRQRGARLFERRDSAAESGGAAPQGEGGGGGGAQLRQRHWELPAWGVWREWRVSAVVKRESDEWESDEYYVLLWREGVMSKFHCE